jgi:hypothetical protein
MFHSHTLWYSQHWYYIHFGRILLNIPPPEQVLALELPSQVLALELPSHLLIEEGLHNQLAVHFCNTHSLLRGCMFHSHALWYSQHWYYIHSGRILLNMEQVPALEEAQVLVLEQWLVMRLEQWSVMRLDQW